MIRVLKLLFNYIINGNFFSIIHLLRSKRINHKDFIIKINKILYQNKIKLKIKKKSIAYFYEDKYLLKNTITREKKSFLKKFSFNKMNIFNNLENIEKLIVKKSLLIDEAERIMQHNFDLLGSGLVNVNYGLTPKGVEGIVFKDDIKNIPFNNILNKNYRPINWTIDFKSGYQWDNQLFYDKILSSGNPEGVDIKVPWELSRCQHLVTLAIAYRFTKDEKYVIEIKNQIIDWINNNPYCCGPNWVCAMDVGIRASNWLVALDIVGRSELIQEESFKLTLAKSIYHHQEYLVNNLEWRSTLTSNHYLSDIVGLFFISSYAPFYIKSHSINRKFQKEIEKEIFKQTYKNGMNSEGSTSYHRLVLELFAYSAMLTKNQNKFSNAFMKRLEKMFHFSYYIQDNSGKIPQIGDNDSGVFLRLGNEDLTDHRYLIRLYSLIFNQDIKDSKYNNLKLFCPKAGIFVYNDDDFHFTIYNGLNGQRGNGGHAHNDKLSFIFKYKGEDIFIDPGTYLYTPLPKKRNLFRSTKSHNTVIVNNQEQNRFIDKYLFGMSLDSKKMYSEFNISSEGFSFSGSHDGYSRIGKGLIHKRKINYNKSKNSILINDSFDNSSLPKSFSLILNKDTFIKNDNNKINFKFGKITFSNHSKIKLFNFFSSPEYGKINNNALRFQIDFDKDLETKIELTK